MKGRIGPAFVQNARRPRLFCRDLMRALATDTDYVIEKF
jgi:hypothetical protein